jgi:signal transduction histidine kinase
MTRPRSTSAPFIAALIGVTLTGILAGMVGMSARESFQLAAIACIAAAVAGGLGALALERLKRASLGIQTIIVALTAIAAVAVGAGTAASRMFISSHDLRTLGVMLSAAATTGSVIALTLGRRVSAVGRWLEATTRRIGEGAAPDPLPAPAPAEFVRLAGALEVMARQLREARAAERALESSRRELVAWVSHDLRTPLAGIRAMAEALEDEVVADSETTARYHRTMRIEADRLSELVDDLFELSRIHAGSLRLEMQRVNLEDLVSDALSAASGVARSEGVALDRYFDPNAPPLYGSAPDLARVIRNLLENAIRHTPSDGIVRVETGTDDDHAVIVVADSCGGIPSGDIDRVFDVAWRGEAARTPGGDGGGGLGLAIARGIVEAHRGAIDVRNEGPGCRFTVRLPLDKGSGVAPLR